MQPESGVFIMRCGLEDALKHTTVGVGEGNVAARHYSFGNLTEFFEGNIGHSSGRRTFGEAGDECAGKSGSVDVYTYTYYSSGVKHCVDSGFGVVAHDESAELQIRPHKGVGGVIPHPNLGIVVFEIGCVRSGADVAPLPYYGISEITVMGFI